LLGVQNRFGASASIKKHPTTWGDEMGVKGALWGTRIIYQMLWVAYGPGKSSMQ